MKADKTIIITLALCSSALVITVIVLLILTLVKYMKAKNNMQTQGFINPVSGRISSKFSYRTHPITGQTNSFHNGVDIAVVVGTEVHCPADGTVTTVNTTTAGGKQIIITHLNGWKTGYAHLSEQLVSVGQTVTQNQIIAKSGNTGNSTGPHLHFTLTNPEGEKVDPQDYFTF